MSEKVFSGAELAQMAIALEELRRFRSYGTVDEFAKLTTDKKKIGKWPIKTGDTICGAKIVGADFPHGTVTLNWTKTTDGRAL